ncbi:glycosyltransferase family 4 protein [Pigmentiphaga aceris]|uniref:Glycosyltransferase family 4 protein n=1 Tax=Pigmentiphaga aceris TaxID=1940612 RepID=A0A5C0B203_9BURK|nr:glycosyltransferase family 1 protein [Pigmentiphaga aceris]QEI08622.1 glycosyltransferase family 4 protein [Pigmentiphaga aceris]
MKIAIDLQAAQTPSSRQRGIGRASLALVQSMVRFSRNHDIHIVLNEAYADVQLSLRMALAPLPADRFHWFNAPTNPEFGVLGLTQIGERLRERAIAKVDADLVHVCSLFEGLSDAARTSIGHVPDLVQPLTSATLYDLIPLLRPDPYLVNPDVRSWYYRKVASLKRAGLLLAISDYARTEAIDALELDPERIVSISCGADPIFKPVDWQPGEQEALRATYALTRPYVMYTGGDDERKNLKGLIAGWAAVPAELRTRHHLLIVCRLSDVRRLELQQYASSLGMGPDELVLPGAFVPDQDLRSLYAACALFVFPSLHEGFGLPVLEAMLCGAPVIAADTSSLPEVLGRPDALFDPKRTESIRDAIANTLSDPAKLASLREHGLIQSRKFSWDISADRALDAFEMAYAREQFEASTRVVVPADNRRLAVMLGTPVADSLLTPLVEGLRSRHEVELVGDYPAGRPLADRFDVRSPAWADAHASRYVRTLHLMGTDDTPTAMADAVARRPGPVVLQSLGDPALNKPDFEALFRAHGWRASRLVKKQGLASAAAILPLTLPQLSGASALFAADNTLHQQLVTWFGARAAAAVPVLPLVGVDAVLDALEPRPALVGPAAEVWRPNHFYVDITMLARHDLRTGIQRVVRSVLAALPEQLPAGWILAPVCAHGLHGYVHADALLADWLDLPLPDSIRTREGQPVVPAADDQFLGLDWVPQLTVDGQAHLDAWRAKGVRVAFVVYDLLPVLAPQFFPAHVTALSAEWLSVIGSRADGLVAISNAVADELRAWYAAHPAAVNKKQPAIGWFHLGADLAASLPTTEADPAALASLDGLAAGKTVLSVGTIEPRKGHDEALASFERLWADGVDVNWVVIGQPGWQTEALSAKLREHSQSGRRLLWLENASDAVLAEAYRRADLLLVASQGEGFGLPLIEGARQGLPLLVRDIPVFREVAGDHAAYFGSGQEGAALPDLTRALAHWVKHADAPASTGLAAQSWAASTRELISLVLDQRWQGLPAAGAAQQQGQQAQAPQE